MCSVRAGYFGGSESGLVLPSRTVCDGVEDPCCLAIVEFSIVWRWRKSQRWSAGVGLFPKGAKARIIIFAQ